MRGDPQIAFQMRLRASGYQLQGYLHPWTVDRTLYPECFLLPLSEFTLRIEINPSTTTEFIPP